MNVVEFVKELFDSINILQQIAQATNDRFNIQSLRIDDLLKRVEALEDKNDG